jgi:hypothetical protein
VWLATLTTQGRAVGYAVVAALQDPRKEVMPIRNLFPDRIAMRLDEPEQVDMVLGDGARDRGALADLISTNEAPARPLRACRLPLPHHQHRRPAGSHRETLATQTRPGLALGNPPGHRVRAAARRTLARLTPPRPCPHHRRTRNPPRRRDSRLPGLAAHAQRLQRTHTKISNAGINGRAKDRG